MQRRRVKLEVELDLDPVPGTFHDEESAREQVEAMLRRTVPHYNPTVLINDRP